MGVAIPQVVSATEDRASGALVIDGGLKFDDSKSQYLTRTPSSAGNRRTWTWSAWVKRTATDQFNYLFDAVTTDPSTGENRISFQDDEIKWYSNATTDTVETSALFRDYSGWYHLTVAYNSTASTDSNRIKIYVNGVQQILTGTYPSFNVEPHINNTRVHRIASSAAYGREFGGLMTQVYLIDGYTLDSSYFGYTDPLTNIWRPKKYKTSIDTYVNNGTVWSNSWGATGSTGNVDNGANAFNGNLSNYASNQNSNTTVVWQPSSPIPVRRTLRVYAAAISSGSGQVAVNGTDLGTIPGSTPQWWTIQGATQLEKISLTDTGPTHGRLYAVEVDGVILVNSSTSNSLVDNYFFGTNGFYLPLDGNTPIGQDQSGRGNNWTPVNFGGSNTLEKATGALPILNTDGGGKVARVGVRTDSSASSLVLALPLVGIKSDFSNAINSGTSNKVVTANDNAGASSAQSNFYGGSFVFDGTGDTLSVPSSSDFQIWSGAFTVECWFYLNSLVDSRGIFGVGNRASTTTRCFLITRSSGNLQFDWDGWSADGSLSVSAGLSAGRWYHCAVVSNGSTVSIYVNGVSLGSASIGSSSQSNAPLSIGALGASSNPATNDGINGYIQDFRIYKGVAKYTQNFIPASTDPDILPDTPSGVAYSSNVALVPSTDGAVAFDNDGDYLSLASSSDFALGTNDWTIEWFAYPTSNAQYQRPFYLQGSNVNTIDGVYTDGTGIAFGRTNVWASSTATNPLNRWNHYALVHDSTNMRLYINGVQVLTDSNNFGTDASKSLNIAYSNSTFGGYFAGQISNFHIVKDQALYTSNFTPPTAPISSVANTKLLCCKSQTSATAADVTPGTITANGNAKATNFNPFTVNINTQRGQESGYCTLNPLDNGGLTLSNGNLNAQNASASNVGCRSTIKFPSSGKFYCEATYLSGGGADNLCLGISPGNQSAAVAVAGNYHILINSSGTTVQRYSGASLTSYSGFPAYSAPGAVLQIAYDADNQKIWFGLENFWMDSGSTATGNPATGINATLSGLSDMFLSVSCYSTTIGVNFGQKPFKFPPPPGFQPLALANTPRPTIVRPDQYVGVSTWSGARSGSGGLTRQISTVFQPDFVWIKQRNQSFSTGHQLYDSVRGAGAEKELNSSGTAAEGAGNIETYGWLNSFDKTGFTVKGGSTDYDYVDKSGTNYVAWAWKAGGNSNTYNINDVGYATASAAGLTAGTITPTGASVNTKSGFSIVTWTGNGVSSATIAHGLNASPAFIITVSRDGGSNWNVYHKSLATNNLLFFTTSAAVDVATGFGGGGIGPGTSSVINFTQGTSNVGNANANNVRYVAYVWAEIPGFSKFGGYTGNGSADGTMVVTGFRPRWVLIKRTDTSTNWMLRDSARSTYNVINTTLAPNVATTESGIGDIPIDFLSNGFKLRDASSVQNASSATYVYAAFAETPSFNLYGGQANAR